MNHIAIFFQALFFFIKQVFLWIYDNIVAFAIWATVNLIDLLLSLIPQYFIDLYFGLDFSLVNEAYDLCGYLLPVDAIFFMCVGTLGVMVGIRTIRWVVGCIPTIDG